VASVKAAEQAANTTIASAQPADLLAAIRRGTGLKSAADRVLKTSPTVEKVVESGGGLMDDLFSKIKARRPAFTGAEFRLLAQRIADGELEFTGDRFRLALPVACANCAVAETCGSCICEKVRFCGQKCMAEHWNAGHVDECTGQK
jgi:hypothetical protein